MMIQSTPLLNIGKPRVFGKKKKAEKVASFKQRFRDGFTNYLKETEGADEKKAHEVVEQIWTIIENAANYMFQQEPLHSNMY